MTPFTPFSVHVEVAHLQRCDLLWCEQNPVLLTFVLKGGPGTLPMSGDGGVDSPWIVQPFSY